MQRKTAWKTEHYGYIFQYLYIYLIINTVNLVISTECNRWAKFSLCNKQIFKQVSFIVYWQQSNKKTVVHALNVNYLKHAVKRG